MTPATGNHRLAYVSSLLKKHIEIRSITVVKAKEKYFYHICIFPNQNAWNTNVIPLGTIWLDCDTTDP